MTEIAWLPSWKFCTYFGDTIIATNVARYLSERLLSDSTNGINLRTLKLGYELASTHPESWKELLGKLLPAQSPRAIAEDLILTGDNLDNQVNAFRRMTGLSRRTFFNYKKDFEVSETSSEEPLEVNS